MIRQTLLLIYRNFRRFRSTFFINLIGLSSGLACAMLIYLWVAHELGVDRFHQKRDRLFQVMTNQNRPDGIVTLGEGPGLLEDEMPAEFPEIEYAVGSSGVHSLLTLSAGGDKLSAQGQFVGEHFFTVFSYPLLYGRADKVLTNKNSIVLSEKTAIALFGTADGVVGKSMEWYAPGIKMDVLVSGVFRNVRDNSSIQFDYVLSYKVYEDFMEQMGSLRWGNHNAVTYLLLKPNTDVAAFNAKIENFVAKRDPGSNITLFAKAYDENYLYGKYENGKVVGGRITYVRLFVLIGLFILLIACINFMNLATAKAFRRLKEVGIRKALGAQRKTLVTQYLSESLLMAAISMAIAVLAVDILLPRFNLMTGKHLSMPLNSELMLAVGVITLVTGLIAGSYPALYLSGFDPAVILKSRFGIPGGDQWARKGLVVFQFTLAICFISSVWIIYEQLRYVQSKNLGYTKEHVISFPVEGAVADKFETFLNELEKIPGVSRASAMRGSVMGFTSFTTGSFNWKGMDPNRIIQFEHLGIHYDLIELLDIEVVQGRSFSEEHPSDNRGIIFNETAIEVMGLQQPVGEIFNLWGNDYTIIGVVKDFHFQSLHEEVKPLFLRLTPEEYNRVLVRIEPEKTDEVLASIGAFYKNFNHGYAFKYEFLDEEYQAQYAGEQRVATLSKYFAGLAILISCLGLFGLASFTAEQRFKEIGIRKVLGSTSIGIVYLLSAGFNKIVGIAIVIALPLSYLATDIWLATFAYRIDLQWSYFAGAGLLGFLIAWLTVAMQAWKAATVNPVKCLRDE